MREIEAEDMCSSVAASEHGGDLYLLVDLYGKAVENRYINTAGIHMHKYANTHTHTKTHLRGSGPVCPLLESPSLPSYTFSSLSSLLCALTLSG